MQDKSTILIVDDTKENIDVLVKLLDTYDLIPSLEGASAIEIAKHEKIDLILLDIMMPLMDGFEVCRRLKSDAMTAKIPIIFLSARNETDSIQKGFELGGVDYVCKPFEPKELMMRVKNHLELERYKKTLEQRVQEEVQKNIISQQLLFQQSKQAALGELLMHISHQWKQPLAELSSITTLMHSHLDLGIKTSQEEHRATLEKCDDIIDFMSQTINTFSNFYKPSHEIQAFNAKKAIERTIVLLTPTFYFDFIKVKIQEDAPCILYANENHFSQIIFSLLTNARDIFKVRKTLKPHIIICISKEKITFEDNAGGVKQENLEKIFHPFFSTNDSSGFGLHLSRLISEKNGWNLSCANTSQGAIFTLEFSTCKI